MTGKASRILTTNKTAGDGGHVYSCAQIIAITELYQDRPESLALNSLHLLLVCTNRRVHVGKTDIFFSLKISIYIVSCHEHVWKIFKLLRVQATYLEVLF